ncbi:hypothetical protein E3N88_33447 [Mikania micrantha]|uniref:Uncharacterized protein n=1 Tax=Mikania micrantha TaxID=192012 RepID=A0A5N6MBZ4_9ASTR|nr:hypothetical protein E3N88_33447 [Mikania micrantha]
MENHDLEHGNEGTLHDRTQRLLDRLQKLADNEPDRFSPSIAVVPNTLRDLSAKSFSPREVSIGPLHHNHIKGEMQKENYLLELLICIPFPKEDILKSCMQKVYNSMEKILICYGYAQMKTNDDKYNELAEMMVMDACFILGLCNNISEYDESYRGNMVLDRTIIYDLVLLENQIPFFVLDQIFQCTILKFKTTTTLLEFIRPLLNLLNVFQANINIDNISISENDHILSILYQCYKPQHPIIPDLVTSPIHSAVYLAKAGVSFKPARNPKWLLGMDVKLSRFSCCFSWCFCTPTLRMPVLYVHDFTELVLRNLVAYEQHSSQTSKFIASYAYAMDMLVTTQEDVAKLIDSKVVVNSMGSNEEAAKMMNSICKEVASEHWFYEYQWKILRENSNSYCQKNIVELRNTYCRSPWTTIALLVGIIIFALTVIQTIYTIESTRSK